MSPEQVAEAEQRIRSAMVSDNEEAGVKAIVDLVCGMAKNLAIIAASLRPVAPVITEEES